jgi:hypothetical protein
MAKTALKSDRQIPGPGGTLTTRTGDSRWGANAAFHARGALSSAQLETQRFPSAEDSGHYSGRRIVKRQCAKIRLFLVINNDVRKFFPFREGSSNGDSATFAIGGEDHANSVNDLSAFLNC